MNNDLISRDALKKAIEPYRYATDGVFEGISLIIDNAPTVDIPTELCKGCRFLKDCETCEEKLRPQGEWRFNVKWQDYECPFCNEWVRPNIGGLPNFCPNCGADMRRK